MGQGVHIRKKTLKAGERMYVADELLLFHMFYRPVLPGRY